MFDKKGEEEGKRGREGEGGGGGGEIKFHVGDRVESFGMIKLDNPLMAREEWKEKRIKTSIAEKILSEYPEGTGC